MIKEVTGDILLTSADTIVHGVAPNDHFDTGLAFSLRELYPDMYKEFRHYCKQHSPKPGAVWAWKSPEGKKIVSLFTQEPAAGHQGHPGTAHLKDVKHSLKDLAKWAGKESPASMALPKLATGVGRLDWAGVLPLLHDHLDGLGIPVYVYAIFAKGVQAEE